VCPCDLRQHFMLPSLQQDMPSASDVKASAENGCANRNATSARANQRMAREGITPSIRSNRPKTSIRTSKERQKDTGL
jgi:hypothetical protein